MLPVIPVGIVCGGTLLIHARGKQRAILRDKLFKEVEEARAQVELAKKALEDGKEALPE